MQRTYLNGVSCAVLFFFALNLPSTIFGQELTFVPSLESFHGDMELNMMSQTTENKHGGQVDKASDRVFHEKINLSADGFVYHPRLLLFKAGLAEGLVQDRATGGPGSGSRSGSAMDYELRATILPEHPYKLDLFTLHNEFSDRATTFMQGQTSTLDESGAAFSYRGRPFSFGSSYSVNSSESAANRVDSRSYRAHAGYVMPLMSNLANYSHSESASSTGAQSTNLQYGYGNAIRFADVILDSRINKTETEQTKFLVPSLQSNTLTWTEQLATPLPWNFTAAASFEYLDENDRTAADIFYPAHEAFNRSSSTAFNLTHRLYQSLATSYSLNDLSSKSVSGEFTTRSEALGSTYTKAIPTGQLTASVSLGRMETERLGTPSIINELHSSPTNSQFPLNQQNVIDNTIMVQVKDPATGVLVMLPQSGYLIGHQGNSVLITIVSVLPLVQTDPAASYEFHFNYSLSQQSKTNGTSKGYSLKADFLNNLLSAYYSYVIMDQEVPSGSIAGGGEKSESETVGMSCRIDRYSGMVERQRFRSSMNPYESWKGMAQYLSPLSDRTNLYADISYAHTEYFPSSSLPIGAAYQQKNLGLNVRMDTKFPSKKLNLFVTGSYTVTRSLVDSDIISLSSFLIWRIGLISLETGVQTNRSASTSATGTNALLSTYYYATLRRALF